MALYFSSLNSGSNGNCYYVGNDREAVLVDVGLSCKEVEKRMNRSGLSMETVKAIFISHEHSDHIKGLTVLAKKYNLPVYISQATLISSRLQLIVQNVFAIGHEQNIQIGGLSISVFSKFHDAADPYSFSIAYQGVHIGVFTDIGSVCDRLIGQFKKCHAAFLEANYDTQMLENGSYPYYLKRRITSGRGHLSNHQALELFINHKADYMSHLLLSHLSKDNNDPVLVEKMFSAVAGNTLVKVASRDMESLVYYIKAIENKLPVYEFHPELYQPEQLNLFQ